jgi:AcrR family transcriptional regulator
MPRIPVTRERISDAALAIVEEDGLETLTMRGIGARLGVEAMTLYHHVSGKDEILDLLVARVMAEAGAMTGNEGSDWRSLVRDFAVRYRTALLRHAGLLPLVATRPARGSAALKFFEDGLRVLADAGFSPEQCFCIGNAVAMFVIGHALAQAGRTPGHRKDSARRDIDKGAFPAVAAAVNDQHTAAARFQASFDFGLDALLDGTALRLHGAA